MDKRYYSSAELYKNPFVHGDAAHDKIFLLGRVQHTADGIRIDIDSDMPTAVVNDKAAAQFGVEGLPTLKDVRAKKCPPDLMLIGGGIFLRTTNAPDGAEDQFILLRRDAGAPAAPNHLNEPCGICGEPISRTAIKECNEELALFLSKPGQPTELLMLEDDTGTGITDHEKAEQIEQIQKSAKRSALVPGIQDDVKLRHVALTPSPEAGEHMKTVSVFVDGKPVEQRKMIVIYEEEYNTLSMRRDYQLDLSALGGKLTVVDGEVFERDVEMHTLKSLCQEEKVIPALKTYSRRLAGLEKEPAVTPTAPRRQALYPFKPSL